LSHQILSIEHFPDSTHTLSLFHPLLAFPRPREYLVLMFRLPSLVGYPLDAGTSLLFVFFFGSSLTRCWSIWVRVLVYSPQIYENYSLESGEGLSLLFLLSWIIGDVCNVVGAILGALVSTVIIIAIFVRTNTYSLSLFLFCSNAHSS
jgi:hypothetical protein